MSTQLPTRQQVDTATPLDFGEREKQANITIEAGPLGLVVRVEYTGPLSGIPAAIERLRAAGVLELVKPATSTAPLNTPRKAAQRVAPQYLDTGAACCPVHGKELLEGRFGPYCPSRAEGEHANPKGYCNIRFTD